MNTIKITALLLTGMVGVNLGGCATVNTAIPNISEFKGNPDAVFLSCVGQDIKFLISGNTNDAESYWTDVVINGETLIVPKFGEYEFKGTNKRGDRVWWIVDADTYKDGYASLNSGTGEFHATVKRREFRAECANKGNGINFN